MPNPNNCNFASVVKQFNYPFLADGGSLTSGLRQDRALLRRMLFSHTPHTYTQILQPPPADHPPPSIQKWCLSYSSFKKILNSRSKSIFSTEYADNVKVEAPVSLLKNCFQCSFHI
ncbi:hypothetical protein GWI33_010739 [Rhynchophorus ferrugineus]|uniref:Uncharacterized protein n=1 Tax=Rhynchophorus ferrugineus TaxID=354439 RepID=A0A834I955_RHYFE|nr:hypothetical protein GWI33_010739 [Rhynchophorus ferrugineus]